MIRAIALAFLLASCGGGYTPPPTPTPQPTINAISYLGTDSAEPRHDWPLPNGYVILTNKITSPSSATQSWDFITSDNGDGFQTAEVGGDGWVRFPSTKDGGTPYVQYFVGARCGGTGWLVFRNDATNSWKDYLARLSISPDPNTCPPLGQAYTRYRLETIAFPFAVNGMREVRDLSTVVSEHYSGDNIQSATALERSYLSKDYGLVRWEAWSLNPPTITDLPERCSPVDYSVPPASGWYMNDCRTYTNIK